MKTTLATFLLASSLSIPALASPVVYTVDDAHTFPRFSYSHFGFSTQQSRFNKTEGTVSLDADKEIANIDITIGIDSVDTGSEKLNEHLMSTDFFNAERYPTARFTSTRVNFEDGVPTSMSGELTIKGITKPVTMDITRFHTAENPMAKKPAIGADASAIIKRSDFELGLYAPAVGDEITLNIAIEAVAL